MNRRLQSSLALTLVCASCALRPVEKDAELGAQVAATMDADIGVYRDPRIAVYVDRVARRVLAQVEESPFEYRFRVLDQPEPTAFAAPGGFVYVSRGLLALAQSEDELAGVLGHEITHVEHRHQAHMARPSLLGSILAMPGRLVGVVAPRLATSPTLRSTASAHCVWRATAAARRPRPTASGRSSRRGPAMTRARWPVCSGACSASSSS